MPAHDTDVQPGGPPPTDRLYLTDAYEAHASARVVGVEGESRRVALDRTVFYPTGGGQPHDTGSFPSGRVVDVVSEGGVIWHTIEGDLPELGAEIDVEIDWDRRYKLMRTHTALHVLCGVIWNEYGKAVTGGNMEPLSARMDFEFDPLPEGFATTVERRLNEEIARDRPIEITFSDRESAFLDTDLIRTKSNRVPESVRLVRIVDIVGLDRQADGGTHVRSTGEVGDVRVTKTESKGRGNKRVRIALT